MLADSLTGYISNFEIYTGKTDLPDDNGATYHTVMRLLENHLSQGYCVFMDNYYTSPILYTDLLAKGTDAVGTCIMNRKHFPSKLLNEEKLKKGSQLKGFMRNVMYICSLRVM